MKLMILFIFFLFAGFLLSGFCGYLIVDIIAKYGDLKEWEEQDNIDKHNNTK